MNTKILLDPIKQTKEYKELVSRLDELYKDGKKLPLLVNGVSGGAAFALIYSLITHIKSGYHKTALLLVPEQREANRLNDFIIKCGLNSAFYPYRDFNYYDMTSSHELEYDRLKALCGILSSSLDCVVTTPDALLQYTMPRCELEKRTFHIDMQTAVDITELVKKLTETGYQICEMVESAGQFAVRGGIVDIFPTGGDFYLNGEMRENLPIRIELFGDEIDRMGVFDPLTQRMSENVTSFTVTPSKEIIADEEANAKIIEIIDTLLDNSPSEVTTAELMRERFSALHGTSLSFYDKFISVIYPKKECLLDYFDSTPCAILSDIAGIREKAKTSYELSLIASKALVENGLCTGDVADFGAAAEKIESFISSHIAVCIDRYTVTHIKECGGIYDFKVKALTLRDGSLNFAVDELKALTEDGYACALVCRTETELKGAIKTLNEYSVRSYQYIEENGLKAGYVCALCDSFPEGYELPLSKFALLVLSSRSERLNVKTIICTDISKDGAMKGTNLKMYSELSKKYSLDIVASWGVSTINDITELRKMELYGAIIGKAYYTGAIDLAEAIEVAK